MECHYLLLIIRLLVITLLAPMNPMQICQWSQFCSRTMFPPLLKALFQWITLFRSILQTFAFWVPRSPFCCRGSPFGPHFTKNWVPNALCRFLCRRLSIGKFKLQVSFSLGSFVSDKNIWNALSISLLYLGASWLQAHKPANLQKNQ